MAIRKILMEYKVMFYGLEFPTPSDRLFPGLVDKRREKFIGGSVIPRLNVDEVLEYCKAWADLNDQWVVMRWSIQELGVYKGRVGKRVRQYAT